MKRMFSILLAAALLLGLLPACNRQTVPTPTNPAETNRVGLDPIAPGPADSAPPQEALSARSVLLGVWPSLGFELTGAETYGVSDGDGEEMLSAYIEGAYGLSEEEWEDAALARETGASAVELAVLRFADEDGAKQGEDCLKEYLYRREGDFTGYAPDQARLVADAALRREGRYVGLFICEGSGLAGTVFTDIVRAGELPDMSRPAPTPEPEPTSEPEPTATPEPAQDVGEVLKQLLMICELYGDSTSNLERVDSSDPDRLKSIVEGEYGLAGYPWTDAAIVRGINDSVFEVAVLHIDGDEHMGMVAIEELNAYLDAKEAAYAGFPGQAELLHNALAAWNHGFIALLVCNEPGNIALKLGDSLGYTGRGGGYSTMRRYKDEEIASIEEPIPSAAPDTDYPNRVKFTRPGKDDMSLYDTSAIRAAWAGGDPSGLSEYDRETYDAAQAILGEILADDMTDLEKETAIYHWLVNNVDYDWRHQDIMAETPRSSYEPHGGLVDYTAVCLGYATSFQLLMDLAGVECTTVTGAAHNSGGDHGWNMVRLNGNWYCVDVTWDANGREYGGSGRPESWRYFNVTSDWMAATDHQWDYANTPEATAEDHGQG